MLDGGMSAVSFSALLQPRRGRGVGARSARWIVLALALTAVVWLASLAGLLALAKRVHVDIPLLLAKRLRLLDGNPELIFAGESRTVYGIDPTVAADVLGKPRGYAVNIGFDAAEPLATLGAMKLRPEPFRNAHVVVSVAPFSFNEGTRAASVYPANVAARQSVGELMTSFLPLRVGTLTRFVQEAFNARWALQSGVYDNTPPPANFGFIGLVGQRQASRFTPTVGRHPHLAGWNIDGVKARLEIEGLCEMAPRARKLTVVMPPWAARYDRASDERWRRAEDELAALIGEAGGRCGFELLRIDTVPGLVDAQFHDDMHVNVTGVPAYTRYVLERLKP